MKKATALMPLLLLPALLAPSPLRAAGAYSVVSTPHNMSLSGPGPLKSTEETRVCVFCHTPHHANKDPRLEINPLWSRPASVAPYNPYLSSTMDARQLPGQPSGTSRLCLSCHDGTIALGRMHSGGTLPGASASIPTNRPSYIGADLRNDHPISFPYDSSLPGRDLELRDPSQLPPEIRLEKGTNFVQCTTCHDAHRDPAPPNSKFLVMPNYKNGTPLCLACHDKGGWGANVHATSPATKDDGCRNCHRPHNADQQNEPPLLVAAYKYASVQPYQDDNLALCLGCHPETTLLDPLHPELTKFPAHYTHTVTRGFPCLACHPSHGVPDGGAGHRHLIDFSPIFVVNGTYDADAKSCNVVCHAASHPTNPKYY